MKTYIVYWYVNGRPARKADCPSYRVEAWDKQDALQRVCAVLKNPLASFFDPVLVDNR